MDNKLFTHLFSNKSLMAQNENVNKKYYIFAKKINSQRLHKADEWAGDRNLFRKQRRVSSMSRRCLGWFQCFAVVRLKSKYLNTLTFIHFHGKIRNANWVKPHNGGICIRKCVKFVFRARKSTTRREMQFKFNCAIIYFCFTYWFSPVNVCRLLCTIGKPKLFWIANKEIAFSFVMQFVFFPHHQLSN